MNLKKFILGILLMFLNACVLSSEINGLQTIDAATEAVELRAETLTITPSKKTTPTVFATPTQIPTNPAPEIPTPLPYDGDYIVFLQDNFVKGDLWFYDLEKDQKMSILPDWDINYLVSVNIYNQLAFSSSQEGNNEIYILNYPFDKNIPINITRDSSSEDYLESWSPDGRYLLLGSKAEDGDGVHLKLWDGKTFITIGLFEEHLSQTAWGSDGKLAFTLFDFNAPSSTTDPSEIYVWDGEKISNVSQNPNGTDRDPAWSADGQLAFLSKRNGEYGVYIWDGLSNVDGKPDVGSYLNIASELASYTSYPAWTSSGHLSFHGDDDSGQGLQIYEWDGEKVRNISQSPYTFNHSQTWREDGYWAFSTSHFLNPGDIFIRDSQNETVQTTTGLYGPAWTHSGNLMFCNRLDRTFILTIWDGAKIHEIAQGGYIYATSRNGDFVYCSAG